MMLYNVRGDSDMKKNKVGKVEWWFKKGGGERIEGMALWEIKASSTDSSQNKELSLLGRKDYHSLTPEYNTSFKLCGTGHR